MGTLLLISKSLSTIYLYILLLIILFMFSLSFLDEYLNFSLNSICMVCILFCSIVFVFNAGNLNSKDFTVPVGKNSIPLLVFGISCTIKAYIQSISFFFVVGVVLRRYISQIWST